MRLVFWAGFWAFITDQASKFLVLNALNLREVMHIDVLPPLYCGFIWRGTDGINFGLFSGSPDAAKWVLIALACCDLWVCHALGAQRSAGQMGHDQCRSSDRRRPWQRCGSSVVWRCG